MKRIITAAIAIPLALAVTVYAPDWLFAILAAILAALMLDEYFQLTVAGGGARPGRWFLLPGAFVAASFALGSSWIVTSLIIATLCLMTSCVFTSVETSLSRVTAGLSGVVYCSFLFGFLILLSRISRDSILILFAIIWAGDSAAYYGGRAFGRHALAPKVSPKKTVEGAIAGLIASVVVGTAIGTWRYSAGSWINLSIICAATAIAGQIGDLAESALKRSAGVKDSSSILPGHGGILDRLDSLLFAAPVFFWLLKT
jgi:phosphatidate cytidylyltransferase